MDLKNKTIIILSILILAVCFISVRFDSIKETTGAAVSGYDLVVKDIINITNAIKTNICNEGTRTLYRPAEFYLQLNTSKKSYNLRITPDYNGFSPGECYDYSIGFSNINFVSGDFVTAYVDSTKKITEIDETNNELTKKLPPDCLEDTDCGLYYFCNQGVCLPECFDSDGGVHEFTFGLARKGGSISYDSCKSKTIRELACVNNEKMEASAFCESGCIDGVCKQAGGNDATTGVVCLDSDGRDYLTYGDVEHGSDITYLYRNEEYTYKQPYTAYDHCVNDQELEEQYCDNGYFASEIVVCENGCRDGACREFVCDTDLDCTDSSKPHCSKHICVECINNPDCDSGYECDNSLCVEIPPECTEDDDCDKGYECEHGVCEYISKIDKCMDSDIQKCEDYTNSNSCSDNECGLDTDCMWVGEPDTGSCQESGSYSATQANYYGCIYSECKDGKKTKTCSCKPGFDCSGIDIPQPEELSCIKVEEFPFFDNFSLLISVLILAIYYMIRRKFYLRSLAI